MDYDPKNITHQVAHMCLEDRKNFEPNTTVQPVLREYTIPPEYTVCANSHFILKR